MRNFFILFIFTPLLGACTGIPDDLKAVEGFELNRYLGTWYEIARFDHSYERGLSNVTATYALREEGGISVINKGYNRKKQRWEQVEGKGGLIESESTGRLKVSFFGPFYGAYNIIDLDKDEYQYAVVCGNSKGTMWIMSRSPQIEKPLLSELLKKLERLGFDTKETIIVDHSPVPSE